MKAWCLELDGRQDKDECAKPIVGRVTGPAVNPVAVFSLVRFQETEMRKALYGKDRAGGAVRSCGRSIHSHDRSLHSKSLMLQVR
jgi:hypothetical protein